MVYLLSSGWEETARLHLLRSHRAFEQLYAFKTEPRILVLVMVLARNRGKAGGLFQTTNTLKEVK